MILETITDITILSYIVGRVGFILYNKYKTQPTVKAVVKDIESVPTIIESLPANNIVKSTSEIPSDIRNTINKL